MSENPLHASHENVKRAKRKFNDLKSAINAYINSGPYSIRAEDHGRMTYVIGRINHEPPEDVAWDAVEIVNRLRNALDKAVGDIVARNNRGASGVGFPFGGIDANTGKPNVFPSIGHERGIKKKLTADQWRFIEACKPYPGGNDTLWAVNEVANADKHRKGLVTVSAHLVADSFSLTDADGTQDFIGEPGPEDVPFSYNQERETVFLAFNGGSGNFKAKQTISHSVIFGEIVPVAGRNVLVTLNQQIRLVDDIINRMRSFFR